MAGELAHLNPPSNRESGDERRDAIVAFIVSHVREKGWPPTVREIGEAVGLTSTSTVHAHLSTLEREGRIVRDETKPRAIRVVAGEGERG